MGARDSGKKLKGIAALLCFLCLWSGCNTGQRGDEQGGGVERTFPQYAAEAVRITFDRMKVFDGDTFAGDGLTIRILGLDTPEIAVPEYGFFEDQPSGREAALKAGELFRNAGIIEYLPYEPDRYGRMLAHVFIDGELFAVKMIEAGLAYETVSYYGDNGFPDIAELILDAAEKAGPPPFQEPHIWRREHRREPAPASN